MSSIIWNEKTPIYQQLMNEIINWILDGKLQEGDALPSIRSLAEQYQVNPLTASNAYKELAKINIFEKQRGIGLFVSKGARYALIKRERTQFLKEEWPEIIQRIERMELDVEELLEIINRNKAQ